LRERTPFYPALGNHENESPIFFANFDLPGNGRWYAVRRFDAHFIVLDTNVPFGPGSAQYLWLQDELAANQDRYLLVIFHHPPFSLTREEETTLRVREYLVPLFEAHGVDAVFCGHDHNYERFLVGGVTYVITGGGGAPLYDRTRDDARNKRFVKAYHYCLLNISPEHLQLDAYDLDGHPIDSYTIK
jgi:3',5'-cyclic AMP phosphodiesterase CpdA